MALSILYSSLLALFSVDLRLVLPRVCYGWKAAHQSLARPGSYSYGITPARGAQSEKATRMVDEFSSLRELPLKEYPGPGYLIVLDVFLDTDHRFQPPHWLTHLPKTDAIRGL